MKSSYKEIATITGIILLFNVIVTNCVYDLREELNKGDKTHAVNKYYTNKICSKIACDADMPIGCQEYCYEKEIESKK